MSEPETPPAAEPTPEPTPTPTPDATPVGHGRGPLVVGGVLLLVLVVLLVGYRAEITRSWGLAGDQGRFAADLCQRDQSTDGQGEVREERVRCSGLLVPSDGGDPYPVDARFAADTDAQVPAGADGPGSDAYRADLWGRWAAVSLPLLPFSVLWLLPGSVWVLRRPDVLTPAQRTLFLLSSVVPAVVLLLLGVAGFLVSLAIS